MPEMTMITATQIATPTPTPFQKAFSFFCSVGGFSPVPSSLN